MEQISQGLSWAYLDRFGVILHHNCDKGLLVAGQVERRFGGGRVKEPMRLVIGDGATTSVGKESLDVASIAVESGKSWFRENFRRINPDRDIVYQVELKPGSEELASLFLNSREVLGANDTSPAVGYAPLTETERLVLDTEYYLNSSKFKAWFTETGEDVKVMGVRKGGYLTLTVAMPILDRYVESEGRYFQRKETVQEDLWNHLSTCLERLEELMLNLNHLDRWGKGMGGMYLTVLGTTAEDADSGEVGLGNQVNGLIPMNRPSGS